MKVTYLNSGNYSIIAEGIDATYNMYSEKVTGKGSRTNKTAIIEAVRAYDIAESQRKDNEQKQRAEEFKKSIPNLNIDLFGLYSCEVYNEGYYNESPHISKKLFTGYEVTDTYEYIQSAEPVTVSNTDWYIGGRRDTHFTRLAQTDSRIIIVLDMVFVTGLTLKELIHEGHKSYGNWRKATPWEVERIAQTVAGMQTVKALTPSNDNTLKNVNMSERIQTELQRAKTTTEIVKHDPIKGYTEDNQPIRMAWFASKPCSMEEVQRKHCATYDTYAVVKTFTLDREMFDLFCDTLDMSLLPETFEGGTIREDNGSAYRMCAEIVCSEFNFTIIIDPQGYDYPRYMAIVEHTPDNEPTKQKATVIDFSALKQDKSNKEEFNKQLDHFITNILPQLDITDLQRLQNAGEDMPNELMRIMIAKQLQALKQ